MGRRKEIARKICAGHHNVPLYSNRIIKTIQESIEKEEKQNDESCSEEIDESSSEEIEEESDLVEKEKVNYSELMPEFNGVSDPVVAMRWIFEIENIFKGIKCDDNDKVVYAVAKLRSEALVWWEMVVKETSGPENAKKMTWSQFKHVFKDKFCPIRMVIQLEEDFMMFKQGSQTVQEYTTHFLEMARFAEYQVASEGRKIERYIRGLKYGIQETISTRSFRTFDEVVEAAKEIEKEKNRLREAWNNLEKKRRVG